MKYQRKLILEYEEKGYFVVSLIRLSKNGLPDLMLIKDGEVSFIECKEGNDRLSELQKYRIRQLREMGVEAKAMHKDKGVIY